MNTSFLHLAFLLYQSSSTNSSWSTWVPNLVLPVLGILIVLFCLLSVVAKWGEPLRTSRQIIRGAGIDLQISMLTLLILFGVGLSLTGVGISVYNGSHDYQAQKQQIEQLQNDLRNAVDRANKAGFFIVYTSITPPPTVDLNRTDLGRLQCLYELSSGVSRSEPVTRGLGTRDLICRITDVSHSDVVAKLELVDARNGRVLGRAPEPMFPLRPKVDLQPVSQ